VRGSLLASLLALAACGGGGTQPGDRCSLENGCDADQICDMTAPGGPVCLAGTGDVDGDGIENSKDFCQHLAGGAHDEDIDGIGDDCDRCPIGLPPAQPELDSDDVDSPCDPDPGTPGHKIVLFDGFNAIAPGAAAWKFQGGEAIMTPVAPAMLEQIVVPLTTPSNRIAILASYRIDRIADGATTADAGVVGVSQLPLGTTVARCGGSRTATAGDRLRLETNNGVNTKIASDLFDPASLYRVAEQLEGGTANCALIGDKETAVLQGNTNGEEMNRVGVYARGATARFAYVLVIGR
jgi:hypothetical protein